MAAQTDAPGWFGKLSMLGDFASRRLSSDWIRPCDEWLSASLRTSQERLGERLVAVVFGCALVTLTVQGLTLTPLLRLMGVGGAGAAEREIQLRQGELLAARAGQAELDRMQKLLSLIHI